jgi:hypothetical protein
VFGNFVEARISYVIGSTRLSKCVGKVGKCLSLPYELNVYIHAQILSYCPLFIILIISPYLVYWPCTICVYTCTDLDVWPCCNVLSTASTGVEKQYQTHPNSSYGDLLIIGYMLLRPPSYIGKLYQSLSFQIYIW